MSSGAFRRFPLPVSSQQQLFAAQRAALFTQPVFASPRLTLALRPLAWDSERLGVGVGRVEAAEGPDPAASEDVGAAAAALRVAAGESGLDYLTARVLEDEAAALAVLEAAGFAPGDGLVNLACDRFDAAGPHDEVAVRPARPADEPAFHDLARRGFRNRLLDEPHLDRARVQDLYGAWAANNLRGRMPLNLVAESEGRPAGFISGALHTLEVPEGLRVGFIDLVVVDPQVRQRGLGRALLGAAERALATQGAQLMELNVAASNTAALALYAGAGYQERLRWRDLARWNRP